jgi:hypothetical protein
LYIFFFHTCICTYFVHIHVCIRAAMLLHIASFLQGLLLGLANGDAYDLPASVSFLAITHCGATFYYTVALSITLWGNEGIGQGVAGQKVCDTNPQAVVASWCLQDCAHCCMAQWSSPPLATTLLVVGPQQQLAKPGTC